MAKPLVFLHGEQELSFRLIKVDRARLYGSKDQLVLDEEGKPCELATLAGDGRTLVGRGGTGMGYLSPDGAWRDRGELRPVDLEGEEMTPVRSSFEAPIPLAERATTGDYLSHNVRAIYVLESDDDVAGLCGELEGGAIYKFGYSFRGGVEADAGFLLAGDGGDLFLAVGTPTTIELLGLQQSAGASEEDDDAEEDDFDFGMI